MSLKKFLVSLLCALCAVSLLIPAAFAHGGHGRGVRAQGAGTYQCAVCPVEGCELAGRHYHNGVLYCGYNHANGWCDGACLPLCPVAGCTLAGRHYHNGTLYCGANHAAGYCGGGCGYGQSSGFWGGHHGGRHCGW